MKLNDFINGLKIIQPYYLDGNGYHIAAEHDQFYLMPTDHELIPEDINKMRDLGWFQPEKEDDTGYDSAEGWSTFV